MRGERVAKGAKLVEETPGWTCRSQPQGPKNARLQTHST